MERNIKNIINYQFIDYIIKSYVPKLNSTEKMNHININLFREAMTHVSMITNEENLSYERLEYLGDAVFHMIITEYLYKRYDDEREGFLTKLRIRIERGESMAELTKNIGLDYFVQTKVNINEHILEDIFESFVGAFFLNFGIIHTKQFIINIIETYKDLSEMIAHDDNYKDLLLRYFHQMKWGHPIYNNRQNNGKYISIIRNPFHKLLGIGKSSTMTKAEQIASQNALVTVGVIIDDEIDQNWLDKIEKIEKEAKEKDKSDKKTLPIQNPYNKLMKKIDIRNLLISYNISIPKDSTFNIKIFQEAMTHRSYLVRKKANVDLQNIKEIKKVVPLQKMPNDRLRFLGDSVIHFIIGDYLYHKYLKQDEGFLTRLRCKLEKRDSLFDLAIKTKIDSYILISQNIEVLHGRTNINMISGGFESFIGCLYLEFGLQLTRNFLLEVFRKELNIQTIAENETNYKDIILQIYNKNQWGRPDYRILRESGPDHNKIFNVGLFLKGKILGEGSAHSKKEAEQIASKNTITILNVKQNNEKI
uniref:RNase III domain-containing protein n=1 Tax=viral metagenome TaxID=1070528 RepID=A0A6C0LRJ8_9ZZZZ